MNWSVIIAAIVIGGALGSAIMLSAFAAAKALRRRVVPVDAETVELPSHIGVRLRIRCPEGVLVDVDSDHLFYIAKYGGGWASTVCDPKSAPGNDGWHELFPGEVFPGQPMTWNGSRELIIEARPAWLHG